MTHSYKIYIISYIIFNNHTHNILKIFFFYYLTFDLFEKKQHCQRKSYARKVLGAQSISVFRCSTGDRSTISSKDTTNKPNDTTLA